MQRVQNRAWHTVTAQSMQCYHSGYLEGRMRSRRGPGSVPLRLDCVCSLNIPFTFPTCIFAPTVHLIGSKELSACSLVKFQNALFFLNHS